MIGALTGTGTGQTIAFLNGTAEKQRGTFSVPGPRFPGFCSFVPSAAAAGRRRRRAPAAGWCDRPMAHGPWMGLWRVQVSRRSGRRARARSRTSRGWGPSVRPSQLRGSPPPQSGSGRSPSSSSSSSHSPDGRSHKHYDGHTTGFHPHCPAEDDLPSPSAGHDLWAACLGTKRAQDPKNRDGAAAAAGGVGNGTKDAGRPPHSRFEKTCAYLRNGGKPHRTALLHHYPHDLIPAGARRPAGHGRRKRRKIGLSLNNWRFCGLARCA